MEYNDLINELLDLLDKNKEIRRIKELKNKLLQDKTLKKEIENYKLTKNVNDKKKLYENKDYLEYLKLETEINLLIQNIKKEFKVFNSRGGICEGH